MSRKLRQLIYFCSLLAALALVAITFANLRVSSVSSGKLFVNAEDVPKNDVALLLGTSPIVGNHPNVFYVERIKATTALWLQGKVRGILISGDNSKPTYNEPDHMKRDLIEAGIPAEFITCDYAGLRTLDSVVRASKIFGLKSVVIVSQEEHVERAIYLATGSNISAVGL
ncbi:MAG: protein SanA, partial [Burkholderiales bacterium PBB4]